MDDALDVRGGQGARDRHAVFERAAERQWAGRKSCHSVSPSSNSETMNGEPSCVPISKIAQMFGWLSAAAASASRSKRTADPDRPTRGGEAP